MATGDDALAAGMDILTGAEPANTLDTEINKSRDYIAQRTNEVTPISKGGTGASTAASARTALGAVAASDVYSSGSVANKIPRYDSSGRLIAASPVADNQAASKAYVDARPTGLPTSGGTINGNLTVTGGHIFVPVSTPATSGYTVAYINTDGRISRGASSERYKKYISSIDPASLGNIWPDLVRYQMRSGDGAWKYGYIAERLAESDDLNPFVVYADMGSGPIPDSIDFIALLAAQNAQLHQTVIGLQDTVMQLAARLDALEAPDASN